MVRASADVRGEVALERTPLAASRTLPASVVEHVHRSGETVVLRDAAREGRFTADPYIASQKVRSLLALPVRRGEHRLGVLYFENRLATDAFTTERLQTLRLLSGGVAIALENSLLFEERTRAEAAVRLLADASAALAESLDYTTTVAKVARLAVPVLADWCTVDLLETGQAVEGAWAHADAAKEPLVEELRTRYPLDPHSQQPAAQALRSMRRVILPEVDDEAIRAACRDAEHVRLVRALRPRSVLALPLVARGRVLGAITLVSGEPGHYASRDLALAEELARRVAVAIDNARLYHEAQLAIGLRDEFLSVASHELRTPINSLHLAIQGLRTGTVPASPERLPRLLELAERQTSRMARLIDEMLSVGSVQGGRFTLRLGPVDLVGVLRDVAAGLAPELARARCTLDIRAPATLVGQWDRMKLEQVVTNLLSNAMKFGAGQPIEVALDEHAGVAMLVVRDRGIGIPAADLPRIFERFARAVSAREYGGLGLGLYVVHAIVEAHGGRVRAESVVGEGSTFTVELPGVERVS